MKQIRAKHLREGDILVFDRYEIYVDDVTFTRDVKVKVTVGFEGTGTQWFEMNEFVTVKQ